MFGCMCGGCVDVKRMSDGRSRRLLSALCTTVCEAGEGEQAMRDGSGGGGQERGSV